MVIEVTNNYNNDIRFDYSKVLKDIENVFDNNNLIQLILVDLDEIKRINTLYRKIENTTDVISFEEYDEENEHYLGDIFVCIDKVYSQAESYGHSDEREFAFLVVHGILHVSGYDHIEKEDEIIMFKKQDEILEKMNYRR